MTKASIDKNFDPAAIETKWYSHWEDRGLFRPERPDAAPYTIVNPPPNVTGSLHIGHALDNTLQDLMIRYERLRGKDALWVVGTDHAGIATQMVVERQMEAAGDKRTNYDRDGFIEKVWQWKEESGGTITRQLRRLGCSMDWSREQFTMDPHFSKAVIKVFVDLYNEGLIYRDKRLVNWDPKLKTAISDLEVETQEVRGSFWHFKYPLAADENGNGVTLDNGQDYIEVATTRPETMLADMAVAVNAEDPRYQSVIGKHVILPITGRRVPIIADEHADPELGSGAVKITPGHDFNDFEVGKRAGFAPGDMLNMLDAEGNVCQTADGLVPDEYIGLHRFRRDKVDGARELVVQRLKEQGYLIPHITKNKDGENEAHDAEPRTIATPFGDRGGVVIEPWLTDQWYVKADVLAQPAIEAVKSGAIEIVPKSWAKTYFNWMENIQPWCVSRQLWWGHRIPAWYDADGNFYVAEDQAAAQLLAGDAVELTQDSDVLDTWFSSALWPFGTLGWPEENLSPLQGREGSSVAAEREGASNASAALVDTPPTPSPSRKREGSETYDAAGEVSGSGVGTPSLLSKHYPNDLLISGFDILFFWDARMAMQGIHFMKDVPWRKLYLHGLVRAADGQKMSKSKGNVVDPLGLIDQYGADALRFFMAAMESQGRDIKMDDKRVEGYRNFATKLWNAARFAHGNGIGGSDTLAAPPATLAVNRWIIGEVAECQAALDKALADLRFDAAANAIYHFVWDNFCDWYLELIKPVMQGDNVDHADETRRVAGWVLDQILVMLHPFMPFITEELWHALGERNYDLIVAKWPAPRAAVCAGAKAEIDWIIAFTSAMRSAKNELGISPGAKLDCWFPAAMESKVAALSATLERVARMGSASFGEAPAGASMQLVVDGETITVPLEGIIDIAAEKARLTKAMEAADKEAKSLAGRLSNANFVERAKPEAVEKARADLTEKSAEAERLQAALGRLG
ncbi:valine--tRNA ligase [Sphingorhabdus arenilitoris]|uniref:Valine--tRNA ligase n=1 Tax=Sphingorhabdus arenilitoris TaxID=1490041 RepID=A0ABV8RDG4_9SPHN